MSDLKTAMCQKYATKDQEAAVISCYVETGPSIQSAKEAEHVDHGFELAEISRYYFRAEKEALALKTIV